MDNPLKVALEEVGLSKADLVKRIKAGRFRRKNGKRLHLSIRYIDDMLVGNRHPHPVMAKAIATVLEKDDSFAQRLVFWSPEEAERAA